MQAKSELICYLFVGVLNTLFGYTVFAFFVFAGLHYALATLIATVIGVIFNFITMGRLVFRNNDNRLVGRFILAYGVLYLLNVGMLSLIANLQLINIYYSAAVLLIPMATLSFVFNKFFVFRKTN